MNIPDQSLNFFLTRLPTRQVCIKRIQYLTDLLGELSQTGHREGGLQAGLLQALQQGPQVPPRLHDRSQKRAVLWIQIRTDPFFLAGSVENHSRIRSSSGFELNLKYNYSLYSENW
jgi:hypothetical protein